MQLEEVISTADIIVTCTGRLTHSVAVPIYMFNVKNLICVSRL